MLLTIRRITRSRQWTGLACAFGRAESTIAAEPRIPPLLLQIKSDLKNAMRSKDKTRLDVLRALIAETTNAAKTSKPIETDIQLLALLRKHVAAGKDAAAQFHAANRPDLYQKEMDQVKIVDEYAAKVQTLTPDHVDGVIQQVTAKIQGEGRLNEAAVMKALFGPAGALVGQPVERATVARRVKEMIQA